MAAVHALGRELDIELDIVASDDLDELPTKDDDFDELKLLSNEDDWDELRLCTELLLEPRDDLVEEKVELVITAALLTITRLLTTELCELLTITRLLELEEEIKLEREDCKEFELVPGGLSCATLTEANDDAV